MLNIGQHLDVEVVPSRGSGGSEVNFRDNIITKRAFPILCAAGVFDTFQGSTN